MLFERKKTDLSGLNRNYEAEFRSWLRGKVQEDGMRCYMDNEISAYCYALRTGVMRLEGVLNFNLFGYTEPGELENACRRVRSHPDFEHVDQEGHGTLSVAMNLYSYFVEHGPDMTPPEEHAPFYLKAGTEETVYVEENVEDYYFSEQCMRPVQKVYYGAPGTGKSYTVNKLLEAEYPDQAERDLHCKRCIFHPTYTYGEFVGCIKPMISAENPLDYRYAPGPFTELLKQAFLNPREKYYLVIEEINRGDAPAIFGDIFQLLDRTAEGKSEYAIINRDVGAYFSLDPWMKNLFLNGKIWLPANFNILATMNTADENIFVMDSAFKRRFALEYVPIDFSVLPEEMKAESALFAGDRPLREVFDGVDSPVARYAAELDARGEMKRNWPTYARLVNCAIDRENLEGKKAGKEKERRIAENRKLGPFFVRAEELQDRRSFLNKVVFYLKQDVFADSLYYMIPSFEWLMEKYGDPKADLFELLCE